MLAIMLFEAVLAVTSVFAAPVDVTEEHIIFKRDAVLDARDLEAAALHGVNLTEMFKHSLIKRSDGDDYIIWVHNSYTDASDEQPETAKIEERQLNARPWRTLNKGSDTDKCGGSTFYDQTTQNSPTTGGATAIVNWTRNNHGWFHLPSDTEKGVGYNVIIGGSNGGNNMRFSVYKEHDIGGPYNWAHIGTQDIGDVVRDGRTKFERKYGDIWRVGAGGGMRCYGGTITRPWIDWTMARSSAIV